MRVGMWCFYVLSRPHAKFHRIRSPFDAPTDNYSDIIVGQNVGCFRSPETVAGPLLFYLLSPLPSALPLTARPYLTSLVSPRTSSRARPKSCPEPDPGSRHRWVRIIPKHLQNVSVLFIGLPNLVFLEPPDFDRRVQIYPKPPFPYI